MDELEWADAFVDALNSVGISVHMPDRLERAEDLHDVLINVRGRTFPVTLKHVHTATPPDLSRRIERWQSQVELTDSIPVLIGDRITESARELLRSRGWGWLDLRGHLHLAGPGILVDTSVESVRPRTKRSDALAGPAGIEVASLLLLSPNRRLIVREIAREIGRSPSTISEIIKAFRNEGIIAEDGSVAHRELFWRLAESWNRQSVTLASTPEPGHGSVNVALQLGLEDIEASSGWALTDTRAAALYGAPISIRSNYPPDFYVPTQRVLNRAVKLLGETQNPADRKATIKTAPAPMVCEHRIDAPRRHIGNEIWPLAHPLFVALDLASDPGRGTEVLEGWDPPEPWRRVW
jgi:DNA-binding transcriptional ArsR family regulator